MRRRLFIFPAVGVFAVVIGGVLSAHPAGIVVPPTHAGVMVIPVSIDTGPTINQGEPFGETVESQQSDDRFRDHLKVKDRHGDITFTVTSPNPDLSVSAQGEISTQGGPLPLGVYTVSGTDENSSHGTGTWSYTLTVVAGSGNGGVGGK